MLSFPSQNDIKNFFLNRPGILEKTDQGDGKPGLSGIFLIFPCQKSKEQFFEITAREIYVNTAKNW